MLFPECSRKHTSERLYFKVSSSLEQRRILNVRTVLDIASLQKSLAPAAKRKQQYGK